MSGCKSCSKVSQVWPLSLECGDFGVVTLDAAMEPGPCEKSGRPELSAASCGHSRELAHLHSWSRDLTRLQPRGHRSAAPSLQDTEATACGLRPRDALPEQRPSPASRAGLKADPCLAWMRRGTA